MEGDGEAEEDHGNIQAGEAGARADDPSSCYPSTMTVIPWDKIVELFMTREDVLLGVDRREMTLREAVDLFAALPEAEQWRCGIGIHEPYVRVLNGRPVAVGFLNAASIRRLVEGGSEFPYIAQ